MNLSSKLFFVFLYNLIIILFLKIEIVEIKIISISKPIMSS